MRIISATSAILLFIVWNATATGDSYPPLPKLDPSGNVARQQYASELLVYFATANEAVPELSPDQNKWLDGELISTNPKRVTDAVKSNEYLLRQAKKGFTTLATLLEDVSEGKVTNVKKEVYLWSLLVYVLHDELFTSSVQALIVREAVSSPVLSFAVNPELGFTDVGSVYRRVAGNVMQGIVIPFLAGQLPE